MARGGKQPGAGRPKGSTTKVRVADYFTDVELKAFFTNLKKRAKTDTKIALYFAEQLTGKAQQSIEHSGEVNISNLLSELENE
jgi:hypothetical protein